MAAQIQFITPPSQVVANAFVEQYYQIRHQDPGQAYRFYQDSSVLTRPAPDGGMLTVTTMQGINQSYLSMDLRSYRVEILTVDAQDSHGGGVFLIVSGYMTGENNVRRKFFQSFFLAPQTVGYFVRNDIFRYADEDTQIGADPPVTVAEAKPSEATQTGFAPTPVTAPMPGPVSVPAPAPIPAPAEPTQVEDVPPTDEEGEVPVLSATEEVEVTGKEVAASAPVESTHSDVPTVAAERATSRVNENAPRKSYASILHEMKSNPAPFPAKVSPTKPPVKPPVSAPAAPTQAPVPPENKVTENNNGSDKGHTVFVGRLPMTATPDQLREAFGKFGPVKSDGVQVRSNRSQGICFGFVEFKSESSMEEALKATEVMVAGRVVTVEEAKKNRDNYDGGRFPSGRIGFRNDSFRGRRNFGGRFGRNDYGRRTDFVGRTQYSRGTPHNEGTYRQVNLNGGGGRGGR